MCEEYGDICENIICVGGYMMEDSYIQSVCLIGCMHICIVGGYYVCLAVYLDGPGALLEYGLRKFKSGEL